MNYAFLKTEFALSVFRFIGDTHYLRGGPQNTTKLPLTRAHETAKVASETKARGASMANGSSSSHGEDSDHTVFEAKGDRNDRSTIEFPYGDLETALDVARAVYERAGLGTCELDELAAQMKQTLSGGFRVKTAAAKVFGLVEKEGRSGFRLSELGRRIVQPDLEAEARSAAFLSVPLYRAVFDRYRGHLLPPPKALEREMAKLGVAPKQADKARQAFERAAQQAGFSAQGEDRLVQPRFDRPGVNRPEALIEPRSEEKHSDKTESPSGAEFHPFIQGLLRTLPPPESEWGATAQAKWLQTAASIFGLIYKTDGHVRVEAVLSEETK